MTIVLLVYLAVMCCGYYGYGDFMQPDIVKSLSSFPATEEQALDVKFDDWTGPKALVLRGVCAALLLIKLIIGLPLNMMVIYYSLQTYEGTKDCFPAGSFANKIMRILVVVIAVVIGLVVTQFNKLFALVASVCGPILQCFLPIFLSYKIRKKHGARMSSWVRRFGHALIVLLGLYCLTMGFYDSVQAITEKA
ncbi:AVT1 [Symbiodinium sp. CCMP2592]|nr:AVT1 [Symbiodinium sp. CCMP2592]